MMSSQLTSAQTNIEDLEKQLASLDDHLRLACDESSKVEALVCENLSLKDRSRDFEQRIETLHMELGNAAHRVTVVDVAIGDDDVKGCDVAAGADDDSDVVRKLREQHERELKIQEFEFEQRHSMETHRLRAQIMVSEMI